MDDLLNQLCGVLDDEIERQELALTLCEAQSDAAAAHDAAALNGRTEALNLVLRETVAAEETRLRVLCDLVARLELTEGQQTMSGLVAALDEPWRGRVAQRQKRLRMLLADVRAANQRTARILRKNMRRVQECLSFLDAPDAEKANRYDRSGHEHGQRREALGLLDQRG